MTAPERGTATLAPELARRVGTLVRSLVSAGRSWALHPPEHPAVRTSLDRLEAAVRDAAAGQAFYAKVLQDREIVSIADVYDALRSNRVYWQGLPSDRIKAIMTQKDSPAFNGRLLRRFINLMGIFPVGTLVRLGDGEVAVVPHEHPADPFRPQAKILKDATGDTVHDPPLVNTWETDSRDEFQYAVVEAVDPETVGIDPLAHL